MISLTAAAWLYCYIDGALVERGLCLPWVSQHPAYARIVGRGLSLNIPRFDQLGNCWIYDFLESRCLLDGKWAKQSEAKTR